MTSIQNGRIRRAMLTVAALALCGSLPASPAMSTTGTLSYAGPPPCPGDIDPPGGDGVIDVQDLLAMLGAWGDCPEPCPPYCDADANDDCTVNVQDLLLLLGNWGECETCDDAAEPNDDCAHVHTLAGVGSMESDQSNEWSSSTLLAGDVDLFQFTATETDSSCQCCDIICTDEDYLITAMLIVPGAATGSLRLNVGVSCTTSTAGAITVAPGASGSIAIWVDGQCSGVPDQYTVHVLVSGADGTVTSCDPYTLIYQCEPGCAP